MTEQQPPGSDQQASPEPLELRARPQPVTRINRKIVIGGAALLLVLIALIVLLMVPFYMFSQRELAPNEDQSVVFGIIQAAANSTIDQTKLFFHHCVYPNFFSSSDDSNNFIQEITCKSFFCIDITNFLFFLFL